MKKASMCVAAALVPLVVFYLLGSFSEWGFDPSQWDKSIRAIIAFLGAFASLLVCSIVASEQYNIK